MRFTDARAAGHALAVALEGYGGRADALVLAIARGGVGVGAGVSKRLGLPLDLVLLRRLLAPRGPAEPLCVVSVGGTRFLDAELAAAAEATADPALGHFLADALREFDARVLACRGPRPAAEIKGRTVILVDNGVRTGSTMLAAMRALGSMSPARIIAAAPVAAPAACEVIRRAAADFVCLARPEPFGHVGLWYESFRRAGDGEIRATLEESEAGPLKP